MGSQLTAILGDLDRHRELFRLDKGNLGRDLCKAATDGVQEAIAAEEGPDGTPWAPLSEAYDEWKRFAFPGNPISLLHGHMDNPREVAGVVEVAPAEARVTYGVTDLARREAAWFQEGNGRQPARPFWGFTAASLKAVAEILDDRFKTA